MVDTKYYLDYIPPNMAKHFLPMAKPKTLVVVTFKCDKQLKAELEQHVKSLDLNLSQWFRRAARDRMILEKEKEKQNG